MFDSVFITVNEWITAGPALAAAGCFIWGMISVVFSPCHLASIPLIVAYVGGQEAAVNPRQAAWYAAAFSVGLFITIAAVGVVCALLGRMLGDVGNFWQVLVGAVLLWVALGMLGVERCSMSGGLLQRLAVRGVSGAFVLGLAYGVLSGSCTFGFIAPILAIITVQKQIAAGLLFIVLFGVGHCLPIAVAGSSTAAVKRVLESGRMQGAGMWFRKGAGVIIGLMGVWFVVTPFLGTA